MRKSQANRVGALLRHPATLPLVRDPASGVLVAAGSDDTGTAERWQHDSRQAVDVLVDGELRRVVQVTTQTPLDRYRLRGEIDDRQWQAGDRLRGDFIIAGGQPRITAAYAEAASRAELTWTERQLAARGRYAAAIGAVGQILSPILVHVVCLDGKGSDWAAGRGLSGRRAEIAGMTALHLALDALDAHYGAGNRQTRNGRNHRYQSFEP